VARRVALHRRDLEVLELLAERQVKTLGALHRRFWPSTTRKSARNRLAALARAGYLDSVVRTEGVAAPQRFPAGGRPAGQHVYLLGPKAAAALRLRSLAGEHFRGGRLPKRIADSNIDHQLFTNRVADWLGAAFVPAHQLAPAPGERRHRPDAYRCAHPDAAGRDLVLVEVDLGHYSRARVLAKMTSFLAHDEARSIIFAAPTEERSTLIVRWIREQHGQPAMERVQALHLPRAAQRRAA